jgi:hypothetical protein
MANLVYKRTGAGVMSNCCNGPASLPELIWTLAVANLRPIANRPARSAHNLPEQPLYAACRFVGQVQKPAAD